MMLNKTFMVLVIGVICFTGDVSAFGNGAPASTCLTLYPKHSHTMTQISESPFHISLQPKSYRPGDQITVTIANVNGKAFVGFEMAGFREVDNPLESVGHFTQVNEEKTKTLTCLGGYKNMVTHANNGAVTNATFVWTAPSYNAGPVKFRATVVEDYYTFWTNVAATLTSAGGSPSIRPPVYEGVKSEALVSEIDLSACGDTRACFLYPRHCQDNDCVAGVSFEYRESSNDFLVEMYTDAGSDPGYVAVAFSNDMSMGGDETFACAAFEGKLSVQHGFNPGKHNERLITRFVSDAEVRRVDGRVQCRFVMMPNTNVTRVDHQATAASSSAVLNTIGFDKEGAWHIQLAWGQVMAESNVMALHKDMPASTTSKVYIKEVGVYRGTAFHVMVQVHAALMIIAWTFFGGIVTVIARHYKDMMYKKELFGAKVWFQVHRAIAFLILIMTVIGLIVIFAHYGTPIRKQAQPHAYWGIAMAVAMGLQIIAGMLRPGPGTPLRPYFAWGHRLLGQASHILAAVTMFQAFKIDYITEDMHIFGFITLGVWVGTQLMWHILFEIVSFILRRHYADIYELDRNKGKDDLMSWIPTILLVIYTIFLAACCVSIMCAVLLF